MKIEGDRATVEANSEERFARLLATFRKAAPAARKLLDTRIDGADLVGRLRPEGAPWFDLGGENDFDRVPSARRGEDDDRLDDELPQRR